MCWSHPLFVLKFEVSALVNEKLAHFEAILLNGVIDRPLVLSVYHIRIRSITNQLLDGLNSPFSDCIVDWCLPILILSIDLISSLCAEIINDFCQTFTTGVEKGTLLQCVLFCRVDSESAKHFDHFERLLRISNHASCED